MAGRSLIPETGPVAAVDRWLADAFLTPQVLLSFRRDPEMSGCWLFKEGWPFGGVWRIRGDTGMAGNEMLFSLKPINFLQGDDFGLVAWVLILVQRRRWLKRHAERVPRRMWRRAAPLA